MKRKILFKIENSGDKSFQEIINQLHEDLKMKNLVHVYLIMVSKLMTIAYIINLSIIFM
jgi:hypothetical protein